MRKWINPDCENSTGQYGLFKNGNFLKDIKEKKKGKEKNHRV